MADTPSARSVRHVRCSGCGHVGNRAFMQDESGDWRDVLGGATGVRPQDCFCTHCDGRAFEMVEEVPDAV